MSSVSSTSSTSAAASQSPNALVNTHGTVAPVSTSVGAVSGINYAQLIQDLEESQQAQITDLDTDISNIQSEQEGYAELEANLTPVTSALQTLGETSTFQDYDVSLSDTTQMSVTAGTSATAGSYQFQSLQLASNQNDLSSGFVNESTQTVGTAGTITIAGGGGLSDPTLLSELNGNAGVQAGSISITDSAGQSATINLSNCYTVNDVVNAINNNGDVDVTASTSGGSLVLTDKSGGSGSLTVSNVSGGETATDLGINTTSSTGTITGQDVFATTDNTLLSQTNDGNGIYTVSNADDLGITLSNGTELQVNLSGDETVGDVIDSINNASGNGGLLTASIGSNGGIELTDNSGGSGTLSVSNENGASVVSELGLNVAADGNTISGTPLLAGINSVLLSNLNGGQGITQTGEISLQNRAGETATIDLTGATSLDQVIDAINSATNSGGQSLDLTATIDSAGNGIQITDNSGSTADNLVIQDVGSSTLATQLGIATNSATSSVDSGPLNLQYVNQASSLSTYAPGGTAVSDGSFTITNSAGQSATISVTSTDKTLGDVMQQINSAGIDVTAELNSTGDGIELVDSSGGSGNLTVEDDDGGTTAKNLRISGTGTANSGGQSVIDGRTAMVINVTSSDTLNDLVSAIGSSGLVTASVVDDGSSDDPYRLSLTSNINGAAGQFYVTESGVNLNFQTTTQAQNGLLKVGSGSSGYIQTSSTNQFSDAATGLDVQLLAVGSGSDTATVTQDTSGIVTAVQDFVTNYNNFVTEAQSVTAFNTSTDSGGVLQGSPTVMTAENQLAALITQNFSTTSSSGSSSGSGASTTSNSITNLVDLGITVESNGQIAFDETTLDNALESNPSGVASFFTTATNGFSAVAQKTVNAINDATTGTFVEASDTLQDSITNYQSRISELNQILTDQENQLTQTFANLESNLATMKNQQEYVSLIAEDNANNSSSSSSSGSSSSSSSSNNSIL